MWDRSENSTHLIYQKDIAQLWQFKRQLHSVKYFQIDWNLMISTRLMLRSYTFRFWVLPMKRYVNWAVKWLQRSFIYRLTFTQCPPHVKEMTFLHTNKTRKIKYTQARDVDDYFSIVEFQSISIWKCVTTFLTIQIKIKTTRLRNDFQITSEDWQICFPISNRYIRQPDFNNSDCD